MRPDFPYRQVLDELEQRASPKARLAAADVDGMHARFAALIHYQPSDVGPACATAVGHLCDTVRSAARWLRQVGPVFYRLEVVRATAPAAVDAPPAGCLVVAAALAGLPLLDLAADLARSQPCSTLEVRVGQLAPALGLCDRTRSDRTIITLDLDAIAAHGASVELTFAHELAHLLEPPGLHPDEREARAEAVGALLLACRPATERESSALLVDRAAPSPVPLDDEERYDLTEDLMAFALLDLGPDLPRLAAVPPGDETACAARSVPAASTEATGAPKARPPRQKLSTPRRSHA